MSVDAFFAYARERHSTHLRRAAGLPRSEWTQDPILQQYRFCNVYRELDRTTVWFRENVRDPLRDSPYALLATVLFRWLNRIQSGEAVFTMARSNFVEGAVPGETAWRELLRTGSMAGVRDSLVCWCGDGPYVTGSYIIKTPNGMSKLDGVLWCVEQFMTQERAPKSGPVLSYMRPFGWRWLGKLLCCDPGHVRMEEVWDWLRQFPYMGDFMAYEVVTDLRHTALLDRAPDIMTWANPGPGARRGLNRIHGRLLENATPRAQLIAEMRELLALSQEAQYWPQYRDTTVATSEVSFPSSSLLGEMMLLNRTGQSHWPAWEMREVEHTLCEWDKYQRVLLGQGRPRQVFR